MEITNDTERIELELEPLSEPAWQRVETRVFERLPEGPLRATSNPSSGTPSSGTSWRRKLGALAIASMRLPRRAWRTLAERRGSWRSPAKSRGAECGGASWPGRERRVVARRLKAHRPAPGQPFMRRALARRAPGA
jgi:hypothetical protein